MDVVLLRKDNRRVRRLVRLHEHLACGIAATCAASHLNEEVKCALGCTKIGNGERRIRIDDADQSDVRQIVPLRHHLSAHQDIYFPATDPVQDSLDLLAARHVAVEPRDPRCRKGDSEDLF